MIDLIIAALLLSSWLLFVAGRASVRRKKRKQTGGNMHKHEWFAYTKNDGLGHIAYFRCGCGDRIQTPEVEHRINSYPALLEALEQLVSMVERYEYNQLSQEPLAQLFHARDAIEATNAP